MLVIDVNWYTIWSGTFVMMYPGEPHQLSMLTHITFTMGIRHPVVIRLLETCGPDKHLILKWMLPVTI